MQRWLEQADARRSRSNGQMMAILGALFFLVAAMNVLAGAADALRHAVASLGFGLIALANLRTFARKWMSLTLSLAGIALVLVNGVYSFVSLFTLFT